MKISRRHIAKTLAIVPAIAGAFFLLIGMIGCIEAFRHRDLTTFLIVACILASGAILIAIGLQVFFKYSLHALRNLCGLIGLSFFSLVENILPQVMDTASGIREISIRSAIIILPFILGIAAYKLSLRYFSK